MESPLLNSLDKKGISAFKKDLAQMLRISKGIDRYYAESSSHLDLYTNKFKSLVDSFNRKYKGIKLKIVIKTDEIELKIFLNEKSVQDCFANSGSKIVGVQSIGKSKFGAAGVSDTEAFANELEKAKDNLYLTYYEPNFGTSNVFFKYDAKEKKVQMVYDSENIFNEPSPEFQIAAYYAVSQGYNGKIDLYSEGATLGFSFVPHHAENAELLRKFDPHIGE